jgi:hypothetical protein
MPDRDLSRHVRRQLSAALDGGAPLTAPLPSQARFAALRGAIPSPRWRLRALTVAVAAVGIVAVAFAGPPQPREWVVQSVNGISKHVGIPAGSATPSPKNESATSGQKKPNAPTESPEATAEPGESPEPAESQQSPVSEPNDGSGGGDHSPEPSPSIGD